MFACAGSLDCGVKCKQIRLTGNAAYRLDDLPDFVRTLAKLADNLRRRHNLHLDIFHHFNRNVDLLPAGIGVRRAVGGYLFHFQRRLAELVHFLAHLVEFVFQDFNRTLLFGGAVRQSSHTLRDHGD